MKFTYGRPDPDLYPERKRETEYVTLLNGKHGKLATTPDGSQILLDVNDNVVAKYVAVDNATYDGKRQKLAKGNIINTMYKK